MGRMRAGLPWLPWLLLFLPWLPLFLPWLPWT